MNDLEIAGKFAGLHGLDKDMLDTTHISRDALRDLGAEITGMRFCLLI